MGKVKGEAVNVAKECFVCLDCIYVVAGCMLFTYIIMHWHEYNNYDNKFWLLILGRFDAAASDLAYHGCVIASMVCFALFACLGLWFNFNRMKPAI